MYSVVAAYMTCSNSLFFFCGECW